MSTHKHVMSEIEFAALGDEHMAYVRDLPVDEAKVLAHEIGLPVKEVKLFSLHAADGRRIAITDSFATARANATEYDLETVRVH